jgi:hypothetical protein
LIPREVERRRRRSINNPLDRRRRRLLDNPFNRLNDGSRCPAALGDRGGRRRRRLGRRLGEDDGQIVVLERAAPALLSEHILKEREAAQEVLHHTHDPPGDHG